MAERVPALLIAGGGTGGHVLAGVAVADAWKKKHGEVSQVLFVGAAGGIEEKLVPRSGYPLELISLGSLNRVSVTRKLKTSFQLPLAIYRALKLVLCHRPTAVLGVGGYASGPVVLAARLAAIFGGERSTAAILEQNTVPGFTNRTLAKFVRLIFCAFPGTERGFPGREVLCTGNPVRSSMSRLASARRDPFVVFAFGGSQGAIGMNTMIIEALPQLRDLAGRLAFIHQTGEKDYERVLKAHQDAGTGARVEKFIHEMPAAYAEASLVICRAGASTLSEIAAVGRASVLVPLPTAADNHQESNARIFADAGAAVLALQGATSGAELAAIIRKMIEKPGEVERMEKAVTAFYRPRAAEDIVDRLSVSVTRNS
jgi:UDP-N-acetylglucosamine--N-acetylmuramyl-(pentapeptide) pyrophosphoryl-undecaprenol N-acetylglucosamine transferase